MKQKEMDIDLLTADANYLNSAIGALELYVNYEINGNRVTTLDINRLNGLIVSIRCLSEKHADEMNCLPSVGGN